MAHLFDILPSNFFNVLVSPNRKIYVDCIFIIYYAVDSIEDSFQGDREAVIQKLQDYFDDKNDEITDVDENEPVKTTRQKAVHVINTLKKCGWLGEEELGDYKTSLNLFDYTIKIIDVLESITNGEQSEYTGEIYTVYSLVSSFTIEEGIGVLEQAYANTKDLLRKLKSLKANIYRYYYDITKQHDKNNLQVLLSRLLIDYKQNFFDAAYYNLKTKDSLPRYKRSIVEGLSKIYDSEETMDILTKNVMKTKRIDDYNQAYLYVEEKIRYITDNFLGLDELVLAIDRKNEQYISAAASKILFLTNHSDDIEGVFNRLFKILVKGKDIDYNKFFNLVQIKNLDTESLYSQRRPRIDTVPEEINFDDSFITDEVRKSKIQALLKNNIYGKKEINKYVMEELLAENSDIEAVNVPLMTQEDYVRLILVFLYSKSVGMSYDVRLLDKECRNNFITFQNFIIEAKQGGKKDE